MIRDFPQAATYWRATQNDLGGLTYSTPEHIYVRWEHRVESNVNAAGVTIITGNKIYVQESLREGDFIAFGHHLDADPNMAGGRRIMQVREIPSLRGDFYVRIVFA